MRVSAMALHLGIGTFQSFDVRTELVSLCVTAVLTATQSVNFGEPAFLTQP